MHIVEDEDIELVFSLVFFRFFSRTLSAHDIPIVTNVNSREQLQEEIG